MTSSIDGKDRFIAHHDVAHYPLMISVSDPVDAILDTWRVEAGGLGAVTAFLELVLGATIFLAVRHLRGSEKLQAAEAAQARAEERNVARRLCTCKSIDSISH